MPTNQARKDARAAFNASRKAHLAASKALKAAQATYDAEHIKAVQAEELYALFNAAEKAQGAADTKDAKYKSKKNA